MRLNIFKNTKEYQMTKKLFFILPVVFLVSLLFPLHTLAQSNDPIVLGISPSQIPANQKNIVSISGENLIDPVSIYLNNANGEVVLTYKVISICSPFDLV